MYTRQGAPHLIEQRPFVTFLSSGPLTHQPEPDCELCILRIVEDGVLAEVFGLHNKRGYHDELSGEFVRQVKLVTHYFRLVFDLLLFDDLKGLLVLGLFSLILHLL